MAVKRDYHRLSATTVELVNMTALMMKMWVSSVIFLIKVAIKANLKFLLCAVYDYGYRVSSWWCETSGWAEQCRWSCGVLCWRTVGDCAQLQLGWAGRSCRMQAARIQHIQWVYLLALLLSFVIFTSQTDPKVKNVTSSASAYTPVVLDNVYCSGRESKLGDCWKEKFIEFCSHESDAGVDCTHVIGEWV